MLPWLRLIDIPPIFWCMANTAIRAIPTIMIIIVGVAGNTLHRGPGVDPIGMAFCTGQVGVFADQWETGIVVIESHISPTACNVARRAIRTELAVVFIPRGMTGVTISRCAFIYTIGMACRA